MKGQYRRTVKKSIVDKDERGRISGPYVGKHTRRSLAQQQLQCFTSILEADTGLIFRQ